MKSILSTVFMAYLSLMIVALATPTVGREDSTCSGYAWLHINCPRPLAATLPDTHFEGEITEAEAYTLAGKSFCSVPTGKVVRFRLHHGPGKTYDYCIFFKKAEANHE